MLQPKSVKQAVKSAQLQEMTVEAIMKRQKFPFHGNQMVINRGSGKEMVKSGQINRGHAVQPAEGEKSAGRRQIWNF